jgi:ABC-type Fe3+/spermidine/putrescine transport system ATPase subunit
LAGAALKIAVRPEQISLGSAINTLIGRLVDIAYRGDSYVLTAETMYGAAIRFPTTPAEGRGLSLGSQVTMGWSPDATILLGTA